MGNIRSGKTFEEIWTGPDAEQVRRCVASCPKNCWMVGTAAPVMKKYIKQVLPWVVKNKLKSLVGLPIEFCPQYFDVGQDKRQGDLRETGIECHDAD
jgi:hypothetical protein